MQVLAADIEDYPRNLTRFIVISKNDSAPTGRDKTSIIFSTLHRAGTLQKALSIFSKRDINLTKIESRPTKQNPWEYNFFLDLEGHRKEEKVREALESLKKLTIFVKQLGSYPGSDKSP
jgi:chorismate mutase / prephenate dehydratase